MTFYSPDKEGVQSDDEAIVYAERHTEDGDEDGYGYTHCDWCGDEWPCTTAALLYMNAELRLELSKAEDSLASCLMLMNYTGLGKEGRADDRHIRSK